jgi:hypothetical protein
MPATCTAHLTHDPKILSGQYNNDTLDHKPHFLHSPVAFSVEMYSNKVLLSPHCSSDIFHLQVTAETSYLRYNRTVRHRHLFNTSDWTKTHLIYACVYVCVVYICIVYICIVYICI